MWKASMVRTPCAKTDYFVDLNFPGSKLRQTLGFAWSTAFTGVAFTGYKRDLCMEELMILGSDKRGAAVRIITSYAGETSFLKFDQNRALHEKIKHCFAQSLCCLLHFFRMCGGRPALMRLAPGTISRGSISLHRDTHL